MKAGVDDYYMAVEGEGGSGPEAIAELIRDASVMSPPEADGRMRIALGPDEHRVVDDALRVLSTVRELYVRAGKLVRITRVGIDKQPRISPVVAATLSETITAHANVVKVSKEGDEPAHPPRWLLEAVLARGHYPGMRELRGVVDAPVFHEDGSISTGSGYDAATGLVVELSESMRGIFVPDQPSRADAGRALAELSALVSEFPHEGVADLSTWLSAVLTLVARAAIKGPVPMHVIDAAAPGTGKSLSASLAVTIVTGRAPALTPYGHDPVEMRKVITSLLMSAVRCLVLDNVDGQLGDAALDLLLTSEWWSDRPLGLSEMVQLPSDITVIATANNCQIVGDTVRRVIIDRLVAATERPESRGGYAIPHIMEHVIEHRPRLLGCALTVLRAHALAGRPQEGVGHLGGFEAWTRVVASALVWAGAADPLRSRDRLSSGTDTRLEALRSLMAGLAHMGCLSGSLTARDILERLDRPHLPAVLRAMGEAIDELVSRRPGTPPTPRQLGMVLRGCVDRAVSVDGQVMRVRGRLSQGAMTWGVSLVPGGTEGTERTVSPVRQFSEGDLNTSQGVCPPWAEEAPLLPSVPPQPSPDATVLSFGRVRLA